MTDQKVFLIAASLLALLVMPVRAPLAQTMPEPEVASEGDTDLKAKIRATEAARAELMRRFEADSDTSRRREAKRDAQLRRLSSSICAECGSGSRKAGRGSEIPREGQDLDGVGIFDPAVAGGLQ